MIQMYNPLLGLHGSRTTNRVVLRHPPSDIHKMYQLPSEFRILSLGYSITFGNSPACIHVCITSDPQ